MTREERKAAFMMYLCGLRGMSFHPGAGTKGHRARRLDEDVKEACDMVTETERLELAGFFDPVRINVPPE